MAQRAPFLSFAMLIFILSLAGIPPLGGFFGKFYLFLAAAQNHGLGLLWLVIVGIAMSAVSLYYYLVLLKQMYVLEPVDPTPIRASYQFRLATAVSAGLIVLIGLFPGPVLTLLNALLLRSKLPPLS
jgi:NADH-quinone oxidoreductase subunit N